MKNTLDYLGFPRPDFRRKNWEELNGEWKFGFDDREHMNRIICVPFAYQTPSSGIGETTPHDVLWYERTFRISEEMKGKRQYLHFGAVDYEAHVWVNDHFLGKHVGGYTPFSFEITEVVKEDEENTIVVKVIDRADTAQPRGKQYWVEEPDRCWYTPTSGIWQGVWLEAVEGKPIDHIKLVTDIDSNQVSATITVDEYEPGDQVFLTVSYYGKTVKKLTASLDGIRTQVVIALKPEDAIDEVHYWSHQEPNLYDMTVDLVRMDGYSLQVMDSVGTYFGMRKVSLDHGRVMINNRLCYLKMILDQGYWEKSGLTPPSVQALKDDVEMTLALGFNGARKHQKIEDPRYYYLADCYGLYVWGEVPSAYEFCDDEMGNLYRDFMEFYRRDCNHPSIITWVVLNESWGVRKILVDKRQQNFGKALYHMAKALDPTRLVSTNDGWENVKADIISIHDYAQTGKAFTDKYTETALQAPEAIFPQNRRLFALGETVGQWAMTTDGTDSSGSHGAWGGGYPGSRNASQTSQTGYGDNWPAVIVTEYGGIALENHVSDANWGYGDAEKDEDAMIRRYEDVTQAIMDIPGCSGFCYTQLTDVYQEVNGLLDGNHEPKVSVERICEINGGK